MFSFIWVKIWDKLDNVTILHNKDYLYTNKSMTGTSGAPHAGCYTCPSLTDQKHYTLQRVSEMFCFTSNHECISIPMHFTKARHQYAQKLLITDWTSDNDAFLQ